MSAKKPMTKEDAARIEKTNAEKNGGKTPPNSFPSRAKRAADKNDKPKPPSQG